MLLEKVSYCFVRLCAIDSIWSIPHGVIAKKQNYQPWYQHNTFLILFLYNIQYISVVKLTRCIRSINKVSTILFHARMNIVGDIFCEMASETNQDDNNVVRLTKLLLFLLVLCRYRQRFRISLHALSYCCNLDSLLQKIKTEKLSSLTLHILKDCDKKHFTLFF